jgi:hypothetical protein
MATVEDTIKLIVDAPTWDDRVHRMRQIPARHGTNEHAAIHAEVAKRLYVPHLAPDFAYIHGAGFYELPHFALAYGKAMAATAQFTKVSVSDLQAAIEADPLVLLPLRVITGLTKGEFAASTALVAEPLGLTPLTSNKVDSMERKGTATTTDQARVAAETISQIMARTLFGVPPGVLKSKQDKPDTAAGWSTVQAYATSGVPFAVFLHQRHYGGAFRQVLDATSELRGNLIEDAVEAVFVANKVPYIRTGSHNQAAIAARFAVTVVPAPDFVVFDTTDTVRAMLECKGANDGGTARDKALRFERLRDESMRLGGLPLIGVLGGLGWTRVNDTLGPVVRDCDGRVFSVSNVAEMLTVNPFPSLVGTAP